MATRSQRRARAIEYRRWYSTPQWRAIRTDQLAREPLCANCLKHGRRTIATVCDHIEPHRGDPDKFWNGPFQSLCDEEPWRCHSSVKQRQEARGYVVGVDVNGRPLDPGHAWNAGR